VRNPDAKISRWNTGYAGLVLGLGWLKAEKLFSFVNHIPLILKTVKRSPKSKLEDLLVCLMAGVESLGQINSALRYDRGLTLAVCRESLADQSLLSQTLDAFDAKSVAKLRSNMVELTSQRSRTLARIRQGKDTILDLDMTDLPCSALCEGATETDHGPAGLYRQATECALQSPLPRAFGRLPAYRQHQLRGHSGTDGHLSGRELRLGAGLAREDHLAAGFGLRFR
jgi:hypothetical protein